MNTFESGMNHPLHDERDLQRTPQYTQPRRDIPVPEKDILDPVAEYNKGEKTAMDLIEEFDFKSTEDVGYYLLEQDKYMGNPDFLQGFWDALETIKAKETNL